MHCTVDLPPHPVPHGIHPTAPCTMAVSPCIPHSLWCRFAPHGIPHQGVTPHHPVGHPSPESGVRGSPLGPFIRLTSMMVSGGGCRRRTTSRTTGPASFRASTALLCTTSDTSTSFTRSTQSFTLRAQGGPWLPWGTTSPSPLLLTPLPPASIHAHPRDAPAGQILTPRVKGGGSGAGPP